jgi:hypothetical protein
VLAILAKRKAGQETSDSDWQRVFQSEGYVRLKKRETAMQRSFEEAEFKQFVLSDQLLQKIAALEETLARWKLADATRAGSLALAYLPKDANIQAKIYPVIKPRENSFVFDVKTDPAIFLYLDPAVTREKFENTLAHELHHIGFGAACPRKDAAEKTSQLPKDQQTLLTWIGGFGEGFAMLAAAGGPDVHPHAVSSAEDRARWDRDVANFNEDLKQVEGIRPREADPVHVRSADVVVDVQSCRETTKSKTEATAGALVHRRGRVIATTEIAPAERSLPSRPGRELATDPRAPIFSPLSRRCRRRCD